MKDVLKNNFNPRTVCKQNAIVRGSLLSVSPAEQRGATFGASAVFLQGLTSEWEKTCPFTRVKYGKTFEFLLSLRPKVRRCHSLYSRRQAYNKLTSVHFQQVSDEVEA